MPGSLREVAECVLLRPEVQVLMKAVLLGYVRLCPKLLNLSLCLRVAFQNPSEDGGPSSCCLLPAGGPRCISLSIAASLGHVLRLRVDCHVPWFDGSLNRVGQWQNHDSKIGLRALSGSLCFAFPRWRPMHWPVGRASRFDPSMFSTTRKCKHGCRQASAADTWLRCLLYHCTVQASNARPV